MGQDNPYKEAILRHVNLKDRFPIQAMHPAFQWPAYRKQGVIGNFFGDRVLA